MTIVAAFLVVLLASVTQALTGFGFALVAVPLLATLTDARTAVVGVGIAGLLLTAIGAVRERGHVRWRAAALVMATALVGMPVGLLVLTVASDTVLTVVIAVVVLGCTLLVARPPTLPAGPLPLAVAGVLAGVLGTSTGVNGPPLVAAFQAAGYQPRAFRATLAALFTGTGVVAMVGFLLAGQVGHDAVTVGLAGLPAVPLGWLIGDKVFHRTNPQRFRRLVLLMLVLTSVVTLGRALL
jgi:uncharacterized membrane protein YfcA